MNKSDKERLNNVMGQFDTAMLVTRRNSEIRSRPMAIAKQSDDGHIWFITSSDSGKIDELSADPAVNVSMQSDNRYLSLSGIATATRERQTIEDLWSVTSNAWFPQGIDDPTVVALEIVPHFAEYWDYSGLKGMRTAIRIGAAIVGNEPPEFDEDVNRKLDFAKG